MFEDNRLRGSEAVAHHHLALGGLLDGRPRAVFDERMRLLFTAGTGMGLALWSPPLGSSIIVAALGGIALSFFLLVRVRERRVVHER